MSAREELDEWGGLLNHPKWKQLCEWAEEQTAHRTAFVLGGEGDPREEDRMRGEIMGIQLFIEYPKTIVDGLHAQLDNQQGED